MNEVIAHLASARLGRGEGPPERRRQPVPELERHDPDGAPAVGGDGDRGGADPGPRSAPHGPGRQASRVLGRRQDRADAPPGRDADPPRPGVRGLRRPGRGGAPARPGRPAELLVVPLGGTAVGTGINAHPRVRVPGLCAPVDADGPGRSARRRTTSTPRRRWTRRSRPTGRCGRSRSASGRSPRTSG